MAVEQQVGVPDGWEVVDHTAPPASATSRFLEGVGTTMNPMGVAGAVMHPLDTLKAIIDSHVQQAEKAKQAYADGRYSEAIGHLGAAALPLVGPAAANAGEKIGAGDIAGGLGEATGLIGSIEAPRVVAAGVKAVAPSLRAAAASPLARKIAVASIKPGVTAAGAAIAGTPGAIVGSAVGDELAARLRPAATASAAPVAPGASAPVAPAPVAAAPVPAAPPVPPTVPPSPQSVSGAPSPAAPSPAAAALPDQKALNEAALAIRRQAYQARLKAQASAPVAETTTPPAATPAAAANVKLSAAETTAFLDLMQRGMSGPDAMKNVLLQRELVASLGTPTPTAAQTRFPKGQRGKVTPQP